MTLKPLDQLSRAQRYRRQRLGITIDGRGRGPHRRGADHYRWNPGRIVSSHGYVRVRVDKSHPLADSNGYAYEHDLVLFDAGIRLVPGEVAHHRNEDKLDNRIENLEIKTRIVHTREHSATRPRDIFGRFLPV